MTEKLSVIDIFAKKWMMDIPVLNIRLKNLTAPTHKVKAFIKKQIEARFGTSFLLNFDTNFSGKAVP